MGASVITGDVPGQVLRHHASLTRHAQLAYRHFPFYGVTVNGLAVLGADPGVVVLYVEGRLIQLGRLPSASGARYGWPSDGAGYEWWEHQGRASLAWRATTDGEVTPIYTDCLPQD